MITVTLRHAPFGPGVRHLHSPPVPPHVVAVMQMDRQVPSRIWVIAGKHAGDIGCDRGCEDPTCGDQACGQSVLPAAWIECIFVAEACGGLQQIGDVKQWVEFWGCPRSSEAGLWVASAVEAMISSARGLGAPCAVLVARTLPARPTMPTAEAKLPFLRTGRSVGYLTRREPRATEAMPRFT